MTIVERALELISDNSRIGLGSGRASHAFVKALGERNGNHILDCQIGPIVDAAQLETDIRAIPGVVGTGLFLGMADVVLVGDRHDFTMIEEIRRGGNRRRAMPAASRM